MKTSIYQLAKSLHGCFRITIFLLLTVLSMETMAQQPPPSCNMTGPLKACLNGGDITINTTVEFSTSNPVLNYAFNINNTGASIQSISSFVYDPLNDNGTQTVVIKPGNTTGTINFGLNVTTSGGTCECSKSITIVNVLVGATYTPILCYDDKTTITATATPLGSVSYKFYLNPGNILVGPQFNTVANFPNVAAGNYIVSVLDNNGCTAQNAVEVLQPPYDPVVMNCPPDITTAACQNQTAINDAFNTWISSFNYHGGTNPVLFIDPVTPLPPPACGGSTTVKWTVTSTCAPFISTCTRTFTVPDAPLPVLNCAVDKTETACQTQSAINASFDAWLNSVTIDGGCGGTLIHEPDLPLAPNACGGSTSVTWTFTPLCGSPMSCTKTFSVDYAPAPELICPLDKTEQPCQTQAAINASFTSWLNSVVANSCGGQLTTNPSNPVAPDACGGLSKVSWLYTPVCGSPMSCQAIFTVLPAPPVVLNCPAPETIGGGQTQAAVDQAFALWLQQVSFYGGCEAAISNDATQAPDACGGTVTVTFKVTSNCEQDKTCTSTFTVTPCVNLGDFVWYDKNNNGKQDAGEAGIGAAIVHLYLDMDGNNMPDGSAIATTTTNGNGNYGFSGLSEGKYIVGVEIPTGYTVSSTTASSTNPDNDDNTDNNGVSIVGNEVFSNYVTLVAGTEPTADGDGNNGNLTVDFGFDLGSIGDFVWKDMNQNGIQDAGEPGIPGVTVQLYYSVGGSPGTLISTTLTDANGKYLFDHLPAGNYCVKFMTPSGFDVSPANQGGDDAKDSDPVGGVVCDIQLNAGEDDMTIDAGFFNTEICYESCTGNAAVGAIQTVDNGNGTVTIRTTFAKTFVDNTYGTNAVGWPSGHTFSQLVGSDHLQLAIFDINNVKQMEFKLDYITAASAPSGYKNLGVSGGEGSMLLGNASDIVSTMTSIDKNLNAFGYVLTTNSPATNSSYTPNPTYPNWIYEVWYEVTVKKSAFAAGFGYPFITAVHASPSKTGNNTECVQLCQPLSVSIMGDNGPCATTCKGTATSSVSHGKGPFTYAWTGPGGFISGSQNITGLCAGTYNITVTDNGAGGAQATASVTIDNPPAVCPPEICYESCTGNANVGAIQTVDNGNGTITIRTTFAKTFVDNTYGTNAIGWPSGHTFSQLVGSDHLQLALFDAGDVKLMEFKLDYITAASAPSGYKNLGVSGGEGSMLLGNASDIVSTMTSIDMNLNAFGYVLTTNSPATNSSYAPNPTYPNWIYDVWYEVTVKKSAFPAGFGHPLITSVHASPSKTGNNTECVQPCQPLSVSAVAKSGACGTNCQGSINVTASHGKAPYSYAWSDNAGITTEDRTGLCADTYTVTVTDAAGTTASATVTVSDPPSPCQPEQCFISTTKPGVFAKSVMTFNADNTVTIRTTLAKTFVDNTYGTNAIGWKAGHKFTDLVGDKLQLALYNGNGQRAIEFKLDYLTKNAGAPSGYKSMGVSGGAGGMVFGNATDVVSVTTSLDRNLNTNGAAYYLFTNSPATDASYTINLTYPNWIYEVWYEVKVKMSVFGASGFGYPKITKLYASPSKTGRNDEAVIAGQCPSGAKLAAKMAGSDATNIDEKAEAQMSLNPNPSAGNVRISFISSVSGNCDIVLMDVNGIVISKIFRGHVKQGVINAIDWQDNKIAGGVYLIMMTDGRERVTRRLVISR